MRAKERTQPTPAAPLCQSYRSPTLKAAMRGSVSCSSLYWLCSVEGAPETVSQSRSGAKRREEQARASIGVRGKAAAKMLAGCSALAFVCVCVRGGSYKEQENDTVCECVCVRAHM